MEYETNNLDEILKLTSELLLSKQQIKTLEEENNKLKEIIRKMNYDVIRGSL